MTLPPRASACPDLTTEDSSRTPIVEGLVVFNYYDGWWGVVGEITSHCGYKYPDGEACWKRILLDGKWIHEDFNIVDHEPDTSYFDGWVPVHKITSKSTISRSWDKLNGVRLAIYDDNHKRASKPKLEGAIPGKVYPFWKEKIL